MGRKVITIKFTKEQLEVLEKCRKKMGLDSRSELIRLALQRLALEECGEVVSYV